MFTAQPKPTHTPTGRAPARQSGLVLIVSLIILLVLTILSITAMQGTSLEEHMAGNSQYRAKAFQLASAALREGEQQVANGPPAPGDPGYCNSPSTNPASPRWQNIYGPGTTPPSATGGSCAANTRVICASFGCPTATSSGASYLIEKMTAVPACSSCAITQNENVYQITAEGVGPNGKIVVVLQSTYRL